MLGRSTIITLSMIGFKHAGRAYVYMPIYEIGSAIVSSTIVSPIMTVIDTGIIKSQFQRIGLKHAFTETVRDYLNGNIKFTRPFMTMNFVYASTYGTANLTEYACKSNAIDYRGPTLIATSIVNVATIAYKDIEYAKIFNQPEKKFPKISYALFGVRDAFTIGASFIVKKDAIDFLERHGWSHNIADLASCFVVPMAAQLFSTPIHILAFDLYQRPMDSWKQRIDHMLRLYPSVCAGRMFRIIPAFGIGGYVNDMIRPSRSYT